VRSRAVRWVVVWVALVGAGTMLALAASGAGPLPGDLALTRLLQGLPPDGPAGLLLAYVGDAVWVLPVAALAVALLWRRWADALFILLASVTGLLVGDALKLLAARPRPPIELAREVSEDFGFPSTTALLSVVLLGAICYLVRHAPRPVFAAALAASFPIALAVGLSRVYIGEHWATDVLGGWLFGVAWLLVLTAAYHSWLSRRTKSREQTGGTRRVS
jgi:membrane-associated phospholipid phosphatase